MSAPHKAGACDCIHCQGVITMSPTPEGGFVIMMGPNVLRSRERASRIAKCMRDTASAIERRAEFLAASN